MIAPGTRVVVAGRGSGVVLEAVGSLLPCYVIRLDARYGRARIRAEAEQVREETPALEGLGH